MSFVAGNIKWIMLMSGALTCTMVYAVVAPQAALRSTFGETLEGPLAEIVVRNWGALITLVGTMLIYGAFNPQVRSLALTVAGASKLVFIRMVGVISAIRQELPSRLIWCGLRCSHATCWAFGQPRPSPRSGPCDAAVEPAGAEMC